MPTVNNLDTENLRTGDPSLLDVCSTTVDHNATKAAINLRVHQCQLAFQLAFTVDADREGIGKFQTINRDSGLVVLSIDV